MGNGSVVVWELDWHISGMGRAVVDLAKKRAKLWLLPAGDLYKESFLRCLSLVGGTTWAHLGGRLLQSWGISEFAPVEGGDGFRRYCRYVKQVVLERCDQERRRGRAAHRFPIPFSDLVLGVAPSLRHREMLRGGLSWDVLSGIRSWCRIRAGIVVLGHRRGQRSQARVQCCIFCDCESSSLYQHVFLHCPHWIQERSGLALVLGHSVGTQLCHLIALLRLFVRDSGFVEVVAWCREVDRGVHRFWS